MPSAPERAAGPPDFVGVGSVGSGTRWWQTLLHAHPEIRPARGRRAALHFFDEFCAREMTDADIAAYHAAFDHRPRTITGEWTSRYMLDAWTPPLLARAAPEAKLLVMVSDPIEHYRTVFAQRVVHRTEGDALFMTDVAERRRYASQLERLQRFFDPGQILVLQFERCRRDPAAEYRRTLRFLGVADDVVPGRVLRRARRPAGRGTALLLKAPLPGSMRGKVARRVAQRPDAIEPAPKLWAELEDALHATLDPEVEALAAMVPELDLSLWPNFAQLKRRPRAPA